MDLRDYISAVSPLDDGAMAAARERQAQLAKPPGSLGRLEELSVQVAGITGKVHNQIEKKHLLVFAADNGVVAEGVSSAPQSVTLMQTINLTRHKTGASTLCRHFGCEITVCDVGVNADIREPAVLNRKIAYGTQNIVHGPAMTRQQAVQAILTGIELAQAWMPWASVKWASAIPPPPQPYCPSCWMRRWKLLPDGVAALRMKVS